MRGLPDIENGDQSWIELFDAIAGAVGSSIADLHGTEKGRQKLEIGAGGDRTLGIDRIADEVALDQFNAAESRGLRFSLLSEETGLRRFGADYPVVLLDPVDGSTNASRGLPISAVMLALADEPAVGAVHLGLVHELRAGISWLAVREVGAFRNLERMTPIRRTGSRGLSLVGLEGTPAAVLAAAEAFSDDTEVRVLGSLATSIVYAAAGGFDAVCAVSPLRVFDMTASLLLLRELGGMATDLQGVPLDRVHIDLETKSTLVAASSPQAHEHALAALAAAGLV